MAEDKMPFLSHLEELRRRLIASLIVIGVGFSVSFYHSERIMGFLKRILTTTFAIQKTYPYVAVLSKPPPELIFVAPAEAFWAHIKIGFLSGILLAIPFILYELWRFVAPGMVARERRYAIIVTRHQLSQICLSYALTLLLIQPSQYSKLVGRQTMRLQSCAKTLIQGTASPPTPLSA